MVFFTCNACGQSIKKNRVEKHWQNECPQCEVLSCMDCGKDFYGDEYISHTSCISEAEKYQGALFKGEKGGQTKGEKKQQEWIQQIVASVKSGGYAPRINQLIRKILDYPNIPRKRAKFENFVKNSINVHDKSTLNTLWELFDQCSKKQETNDTTKVETIIREEETKGDVVTDGTPSHMSEGKKKTKKKKESDETKLPEVIVEEESENQPLKRKTSIKNETQNSEDVSKRKKKRKNCSAEVEEVPAKKKKSFDEPAKKHKKGRKHSN